MRKLGKYAHFSLRVKIFPQLNCVRRPIKKYFPVLAPFACRLRPERLDSYCSEGVQLRSAPSAVLVQGIFRFPQFFSAAHRRLSAGVIVDRLANGIARRVEEEAPFNVVRAFVSSFGALSQARPSEAPHLLRLSPPSLRGGAVRQPRRRARRSGSLRAGCFMADSASLEHERRPGAGARCARGGGPWPRGGREQGRRGLPRRGCRSPPKQGWPSKRPPLRPLKAPPLSPPQSAPL